MEELREELHEPVRELLDFFAAMPQANANTFFSADCGETLLQVVNVAKGFLSEKSMLISEDEAVTIFNILTKNFALACITDRDTNLAMQKAAGIGFVRRIFGN